MSGRKADISPSTCSQLKRGKSSLYPHCHASKSNTSHGLFLTSKFYSVQIAKQSYPILDLQKIESMGAYSYYAASYNVALHESAKPRKAYTIIIINGKTFYSKYRISYTPSKSNNRLRRPNSKIMDSEYLVEGLRVFMFF